MDIIQMARELGKALQQDDRYIAYMLAKQVNDEDTALQADINRFDELRAELNTIMSSENANHDKLRETDRELKEVYRKIMANKNMLVFNAAQKSLEGLVSSINEIISLCANGEDPDTCEPSSGCAECGGCS